MKTIVAGFEKDVFSWWQNELRTDFEQSQIVCRYQPDIRAVDCGFGNWGPFAPDAH